MQNHPSAQLLHLFAALFAVIAALSSYSPQSASAQPSRTFGAEKMLSRFALDVWQAENGMPSSTVLSICQTHDGYIWMGTFGGLVRFDGVKFRVFNSSNTAVIKANGIFGVFEDSKRNLWVGTQESGVLKYANGEFTAITSADGLSDNFVRSISQDAKGRVWFGTNKGLDVWENGKLTPAKRLPTPITDLVNVVKGTKKGTVWTGTNNDGVYALSDAGLEHFSVKEGLSSQTVFSVYESPENGDIWIGTGAGVCIIKQTSDGKCTITRFDSAGTTTAVNAIYGDKQGNIWIGADGGLKCFDKTTLRTLVKKDGLSDDRITAITQDVEGSIWAGTYYGGLNRLKRGKFSTFTEQEGLLGNIVYAVIPAKDGSIWLGMIGGVQRWQNGVFTNFTKDNGLAANAVRTLCEASDGAIWAGQYGGLTKIIGGRAVKTYVEKDGLVGKMVRRVIESRDGALWIGTTSGLNKFQNGVFTAFTTQNGLTNKSVISLMEDHNGMIWIGTDGGGVNILNPQTGAITVLNAKNGVASNIILSITEDAEKIAQLSTVWLSTARGLTRVRTVNGKQEIASIAVTNGLPGEAIGQTLQDNRGEMWLTSQYGILRVPKARLHAVFDSVALDTAHRARYQIGGILYGRSDGMKTDKCNVPSVAQKFPDGVMFFLTTKGLVIIDPENIPSNPLPPPVVVTTLLVDTSATKQPREGTQYVEVPHDCRKFEFQYTALSFLFPEKVLFKYRLDGFDTEWTEAGTRRTAYYTNLEPGTYSFRVIACNNDGVWNDSGAAITLVVRPPWWETWWFRVLQILFFVVLLGISFAMNRYSTQTRLATVITFITLLVVVETFVSTLEGYMSNVSGGVPVLELLMNVLLAAMLSPVERLVSGFFEKQRVGRGAN
ncbi:MAG: hypothetical protein MUF71_12245 [Candidatus Kapabacteria bacterium]|jgi:ligand-binding sensor domain-containing protein|nr:hypothetical protein [Candidatus Kapabacteria bacterium]